MSTERHVPQGPSKDQGNKQKSSAVPQKSPDDGPVESEAATSGVSASGVNSDTMTMNPSNIDAILEAVQVEEAANRTGDRTPWEIWRSDKGWVPAHLEPAPEDNGKEATESNSNNKNSRI